jgi:hypothetical protein
LLDPLRINRRRFNINTYERHQKYKQNQAKLEDDSDESIWDDYDEDIDEQIKKDLKMREIRKQ